MNATQLTCPVCRQTLTISERAPERLTCPRCLAKLVNPTSMIGAGPIRAVLPLDRQVERDSVAVNWSLVGLLVLLAFGAIITFSSVYAHNGLFTLVIFLALGTGWFVYFGKVGAQAPPTENPRDGAIPPIEAFPIDREEGASVLHYRTPRDARPPVTVGAFAGGFFAGIAVCAFGFFLLAATMNLGGNRGGKEGGNAFILAAVVALVIGFIVATVRVSGRWRGFGPGATTGLILGMMALGPCAACYLLTIS